MEGYYLSRAKRAKNFFLHHTHREIIVQLGYNSGHMANPFSPLFYPHRSECLAPFNLMWPRINNQNILDPL